MIEYTVKVSESGTKSWYLNGKRHREDGPAVEYSNGDKYWYINGKLHREDGPAVEHSDGYKAWFINGKRHREDGPAVEHSSGSSAWWLNGRHLVDLLNTRAKPCSGKIVEIDGVKYKLEEV